VNFIPDVARRLFHGFFRPAGAGGAGASRFRNAVKSYDFVIFGIFAEDFADAIIPCAGSDDLASRLLATDERSRW